MKQARLAKAGLTAAVCAAIGAAAGIAGSAAAPGGSHKLGPKVHVASAGGPISVRIAFDGGGPPVHATEVVPNMAGTGFDTVTRDSGTAKAVSGDSLTLTEGTDKATYATPTLTIPADAKIERNFETAKLAALKAGDHVDVSASSDGTTHVFAVDSDHWPPKPPKGKGFMVTKPGGPPPGPGEAGGVVSGSSAP